MLYEENRQRIQEKMIEILQDDGQKLTSFLLVFEAAPDSPVWGPLEKTLNSDIAFKSCAIIAADKCVQVLFWLKKDFFMLVLLVKYIF